jgi:iron complex outermembrane receptor protein
LDLGAINTYNRIVTSKAVEGVSAGLFSSLYVERADFLMLDNLTLAYEVPLVRGGALRSFRLFGTVQRAFTVTGYTGVDPEPALIDQGIRTPVYRVSASALVPGVDRNAYHSPSRTFLLGFLIGI